MLDRLRTPFFIVALIIWLIIVFAEMGNALIPASFDESVMRQEAGRQLNQSSGLSEADRTAIVNQMVDQARKSDKPPGMAITDMALLDGLLLYTVLLIGTALIIPERVQGRIQGIAGLIVAILVILAAIVLFIKAFVQLMIMVSLFLSIPFGTIAYLAIWGFFNRGGAAAMLGFLMLLKLIFVVLLVIAHQRFLQNKGLVLLIVTSIVCNFVIAFLHAFVPIILVSITDAIAALIAIILAVIWAILLLIISIIAVIKAIV
jgi:hypothetical protein